MGVWVAEARALLLKAPPVSALAFLNKTIVFKGSNRQQLANSECWEFMKWWVPPMESVLSHVYAWLWMFMDVYDIISIHIPSIYIV